MTHKNDVQKLAYRGCLSPDEVADQLALIAQGIRSRSLLMETGNDSIGLDIGSDMELSVELKSGDRKSKMQFELTWQAAMSSTPSATLPLNIGSPADPRETFAEGFGVDHVSADDRTPATESRAQAEPAAEEAALEPKTTPRRRSTKQRSTATTRSRRTATSKTTTRSKAAAPHRSTSRTKSRAR
jgi:amphi-Trp domain-containing protein